MLLVAKIGGPDRVLKHSPALTKPRYKEHGMAESQPILARAAQATPKKERWRRVPGFPAYKVSSRGRVKSFFSTGGRGGGSRMERNGRFIAQCDLKGYPSVWLHNGTKRRRALVHHLVLEAFVGPRPSKRECNHIDGDKLNARLENLEWVTASENMKHAIRTGLNKGFAVLAGEHHPQARFTQAQADEVRAKYAAGRSAYSLAKEYGVTDKPISKILKGLTYRGNAQ